MPQIHLDDETIARLDTLRIDGEEYDTLVSELITVCEGDVRARLEDDDADTE